MPEELIEEKSDLKKMLLQKIKEYSDENLIEKYSEKQLCNLALLHFLNYLKQSKPADYVVHYLHDLSDELVDYYTNNTFKEV